MQALATKNDDDKKMEELEARLLLAISQSCEGKASSHDLHHLQDALKEEIEGIQKNFESLEPSVDEKISAIDKKMNEVMITYQKECSKRHHDVQDALTSLKDQL